MTGWVDVPGIGDLDLDVVLEHLARDKKGDDLGVGWVLPTDDGVVLDQRVTAAELRAVFKELQRESESRPSKSRC